MKKIKLLSSLLEQDDKFDFSPGALSGGATVQQPKTDNKQKKSDNTKGSGTNDTKADGSETAKSETEQANSTEHRASLIKLPNCNHFICPKCYYKLFNGYISDGFYSKNSEPKYPEKPIYPYQNKDKNKNIFYSITEDDTYLEWFIDENEDLYNSGFE